jgi:hypothetical protein
MSKQEINRKLDEIVAQDRAAEMRILSPGEL